MLTANTTTHRDTPLNDDLISLLIDQHQARNLPTYQQLWDYYRNAMLDVGGDSHRGRRLAQQAGLPDRLQSAGGGSAAGRGGDRNPREVVIENDIAWRMHVLVDFMFGRRVAIQSLAEDTAQAGRIEQALNLVFEANGGSCFFQNLALLGGIYGFVDVIVRPPSTFSFHHGSGTGAAGRAPSSPPLNDRAILAARQIVLETVEAPRAVPVPDPSDYRRLDGYILHYIQTLNAVEEKGWMHQALDRLGSGMRRTQARRLAQRRVTEIWTAASHRVRHDGRDVEHRANLLGVLPVVHIQNLPQPLFYEGLSEVEPLIPLQDELNTRLSDRANRVTMQSFKMYLGKGIENFTERPIGPGQMWMTDNPHASIESFGGDASSPSENVHINEVRDALDKASAVTPLAAGLLRNKVGNLTSENALRVTMMGLLAKTQRKRETYGKGIEQICELILRCLHIAGVLPTTAADRRIKLHWPSPIPEDTTQRLNDAKLKRELGVPQEQVLAELGYCQQ